MRDIAGKMRSDKMRRYGVYLRSNNDEIVKRVRSTWQSGKRYAKKKVSGRN